MTGRITAALAIAATAVGVAGTGTASAKTGSIFDLTKANGFERVTFRGDAEANCASFGTCGYRGTVTYRIGGSPRGALFLAKSRSGRYSGHASYRTNGVTTASVTGPATDPDCADRVQHRSDVFTIKSLPASAGTLLLSYHSADGDFLDTDCVAPTEKDLAEAGALPEGVFAANGFRRKRVRWQMSGSQPFKAAGFSGSTEWNMSYAAKSRACSPQCRIPAQRPR